MCDSKPCSSRVSFYKIIEKNVEKLISKQVEKLDVSILELINELVFGESVERLNASADLEVQLVQLNHCDGEYSNY